MKTGCETKRSEKKRSTPLPVLKNQKSEVAHSKTARWRAISLIVLQLLMVAHIIQWQITGSTVTPIEPSESMFTLQSGAINAGFIFFTLAILATLVFGRFVCGWGCHIVALQDFCAWLMRKVGVTPKPFRSRVLIFVPLIVALYMFVWPTVARFIAKPANEPLFPEFTNHLITTEFWATFPPWYVAIPFLFVCGFMTVYFLGQKGFCTYACPYGGFFAVADKFAPGKIRVTDACNQCGICTATCMSNVQVHKEIKDYGMVIDPGCMKHMDCISVCPNDALYFGFGTPTILANSGQQKAERAENPQSVIRYPQSQLTWLEEIAFALVFATSFFAVWDVYQLVPMLMALGIACVTTFLAYKTYKTLTAPVVMFHKYLLKSSNSVKTAGWLFLIFSLMWLGVNIHSGFIRYHERAGAAAYERVTIPDELALAAADAGQFLSVDDRRNVAEGRRHLETALNYGIFTNEPAIPKLAWMEYLGGDTEGAIKLLKTSASTQTGQQRALNLYYRGAILNRLGRYEEAIIDLETAFDTRGDLVLAVEEKGLALWQMGRKEEAILTWKTAVWQKPSLPLTNNFLAAAANLAGDTENALKYQQQANQSTPNDPYFHWAVGLRLKNAGFDDLAEKHFARAIQLNSSFILKRR